MSYSDVNIQGDLYGVAGKGIPSKGSRREFEKHSRELPPNIREELRHGKLRLGDQIIYSMKPVGNSQTIKLFETQDDKEVGLRNISNAKLPKNQALLVSGIYLLVGQAPAQNPGVPTLEEIKATPFGRLDRLATYAAILNGEFNLKANKVQLVPETSCRVFATSGFGKFQEGYYKLANPRLIQDDVLIEATIELGSTFNIPQDTFVYIGLHGTITTP